MIDLLAELTAIAAALDAAGIRYALVGGLAYSVWVEARSTEDIDLLIEPEAWPRAAAALKPLGYEPLAGALDFKSVRIRRLTKLLPGEAVVLDFLLADGPYREGLDRRVSLHYNNAAYAVAPPDVLIALKQGRLSEKDKSDIAGLRKLIDDSSGDPGK